MQKVLVTGSNGMLGQDLCPILEDEGYEVIEATLKDFDITDFDAAKKFITEKKPDIVIHCAAYTNVDKAEEEPDIAKKVNFLGTENISRICGENDIIIIYISTDYVFDGEEEEKIYKPSDAPNPLNVYGKTKLEGEKAVQKYCKKYYITRTSWLYGHHGKNFVETMLALADKPEIKVVDDQVGCPTWTVELSNGIVKLLDEGAEYGIYQICGGGKTSWYNFAKEIFKQSGLKVNLKPCTTEEFPRPAHRPKYSPMDNGGLCRRWQTALKEYLALRP